MSIQNNFHRGERSGSGMVRFVSLGLSVSFLLLAMLLASCDSGSKGTDPQDEDSSSSVTVTPSSSGLQINSSSSTTDPLSSGVVPGSSSGVVQSSSSGAVSSSSSSTQINSSSSGTVIVSSSSGAVSSSSSVTTGSSSSSITTESSSSSATIASSSSWYLPLNGNLSYGTMTDPRDNKSYATIVLNGYTVMAQNLNYGTQVNGILATDNQSNDAVVEKYCYNDSALYCERYGGLYQWSEALALPSSCNTASCADQVDTVGFHQGICPDGWHLPGNVEWVDLNGIYDAEKLKSIKYWYQGGGGSNSTGFTFLPAGYRGETEGGYDLLSKTGQIWYIAINAKNYLGYMVWMTWSSDGVPQQTYSYKVAGLSIRCIQNYTTSN